MALFIHSTVARHYDGPDGLSFDVKPAYIGEAPDWLKDNEYFKKTVSDGKITYVGAPPVSVTVEKETSEKATDDSKSTKKDDSKSAKK